MVWHRFKDRSPKGGGFYVLRYQGYRFDSRPDLPVYMERGESPGSYWVTSENLGKVMHDCGHCIWLGSWHIQYQPTQWRVMEPMEALLFSRKLYQFGRPYRWGSEVRSRGALKASDPIIYTKE